MLIYDNASPFQAGLGLTKRAWHHNYSPHPFSLLGTFENGFCSSLEPQRNCYRPDASPVRTFSMRLINVRTRQLHEFPQNPPEYAILSHRWIDDQEVCLQDWEAHIANPEPATIQIKCRSGFNKIQNACVEAQRRSLEWLWADTACINKMDHLEVAKSVNLMFFWYQSASVCFTYLHDVSNSDQCVSWTGTNIVVRETPEWFTRGWTLQELLAPKKLLLFDQEWNCIGDRENCASAIAKFTGIPLDALCGKDIQSYSYADRLSWAKGRQTTEPEDRVYSLLGVLGVSLPAVGYGIGLKTALWQLESAIRRQRADGNISLPDDDLFSRFITAVDKDSAGMLDFEICYLQYS
jgi:hypothetical protein